MAVSRSAVEYLMRKGIVDETFSPAPRLDIGELLVNSSPLPPTPQGAVGALLDYDTGGGRGRTEPWPNQDLVSE